MADPFLGQIVMFGGNFAPRGWALCDGQLLAISTNSALFSILGTMYGGDGRTTFGLPDLRGRVPMHAGNGPGLTSRSLGEKSGSETNTLSVNQLPAHSHTGKVRASGSPANTSDPTGAAPGLAAVYNSGGPTVDMGAGTVQTDSTGSNQSVNNLQPFQCVNFIIALQGTFPSRS